MEKNVSVSTRQPRPGGYSFVKQAKRRDLRRIEAENRNEAYRALSLEKRIELVRSRPGQSKREMSRLVKLLESQGKTVPPVSKKAEVVAEKKSPAPKKVAKKKATRKVAVKKVSKS